MHPGDATPRYECNVTRSTPSDPYQAALALYQAVLASNLDITPEAFARWGNPVVAGAVRDLLDVCHTVIER
jgi:hypothetical protein